MDCSCSSLLFSITLGLRVALLYTAKLERFGIPEVDQCSSHFRDISGAVVTSSPAVPLQYQDMPCYLKFSADGTIVTRKRLMLKFMRLKITDCRVKLKIYDGRSQLSIVLHEFTCDSVVPRNISESSSNFFTLELDLNGAPVNTFDFLLHVTAFEARGSLQLCSDYLCGNGYCISKDLYCDGADSCLDGSDETAGPPANCNPGSDSKENGGKSGVDIALKTGSSGEGVKKAFQSLKHWVIGLIVVIAIILVAVIILCAICCLRRTRHDRRSNSPPSPSGGPSTTLTTTAYHVAPSAPPDAGPNSESNHSQANNHDTKGNIDQETITFLP